MNCKISFSFNTGEGFEQIDGGRTGGEKVGRLSEQKREKGCRAREEAKREGRRGGTRKQEKKFGGDSERG